MHIKDEQSYVSQINNNSKINNMNNSLCDSLKNPLEIF